MSRLVGPGSFGSVLRFLVTGALVVVVDYGVLIILHGALSLDVTISAVIAFLCAFVVNFTVNRTWTFRAGGAPGGPLVRFTVLVAANTVVTALGMWWLTNLGMHYLGAKTTLVAVIVPVNFVVMRVWVFPRSTPVGAPALGEYSEESVRPLE